MSYLDDLFGLGGQTAVVTGGTSGLGAASAMALARAGARVIVAGRDRERGERVLAEIATAGGEAELDLVDVSDGGEAGAFAEWIRHGVNVNAVAPCDFATPMIAPFLDQQEYRDWIMEAIPAGRVGQPEEIVGAVLFLASGASDMVAGHNLLVDGVRTVI